MFDFLHKKAQDATPPALPEGTVRRRYSIEGQVQGVGFRYKLGYLADKYSVTGWARNEYDGSVSTELQGLEEDIDKILQALYNDRYIEIDDIRKRSLPVDEEERGFGVRY